jgi:chromosome segregation ATPase
MSFLEDDRHRQTPEVADLRARLADHETQSRRLAEDIGRREEQARLLHEVLDRREAYARSLEAHVQALEAHVEMLHGQVLALHAHLANLTSGTGWKLLERFRRARLRVIPRGSRRERAYLRLLRGARTLSRAAG